MIKSIKLIYARIQSTPYRTLISTRHGNKFIQTIFAVNHSAFMFGYIDGKNLVIAPPFFITYFFTKLYINYQERRVFSSSRNGDIEMSVIPKIPSAIIMKPPIFSLVET